MHKNKIAVAAIPAYTYKENVVKEYTMLVEAIYTYPHELAMPDGYRLVGFQVPKLGESFLSPWSTGSLEKANYDYGTHCPRLVVEPLPKPKRWIVEEINVDQYNERFAQSQPRGSLLLSDPEPNTNSDHRRVKVVREIGPEEKI